MTTIVFDMSDPSVQEMVNAWADDTEYTLEIKVKTGAGDSRNVGTVVEATETGEEMEPVGEEEDVEEEPITESKVPPIKYNKEK